MKKYVRPVLECEQFAANEFVAACYLMECDIDYGFGFVDRSGGTAGQYDEGIDSRIPATGFYEACKSGVAVEGEDDFYHVVNLPEKPTKANAYWQEVSSSGVPDGSPEPCFYYYGKAGDLHVSDLGEDMVYDYPARPNAS